jgi:adenylate kinase family enzyme
MLTADDHIDVALKSFHHGASDYVVKTASQFEKINHSISNIFSLYGHNLKKATFNKETEKELNSNILKITMRINNQYPELSKYIEEMQDTFPDDDSPEATLKNLKTYYDSLNSMLNKYILEHHNKAEQKN